MFENIEYKIGKRLPVGTKHQIFYLPNQKVKYVVNPKVASMTLKFFLSKIKGSYYPGSSIVSDWNILKRDWFSFGFVRNPVDRFLSCWKSKVFSDRYTVFGLKESEALKMQDLDNYIDWISCLDLSDADTHLRYQLLNIPIAKMDFIGRLESFSSDLSQLEKLTGIELMTDKGYNGNRTIVTPPSKTQLGKIREIYKEDIHCFKY